MPSNNPNSPGAYKRLKKHQDCAGCGKDTFSTTGFCTRNKECKRMHNTQWARDTHRATTRKYTRNPNRLNTDLMLLNPLAGLTDIERDRRLTLVRKIKEHRDAMNRAKR